MNTSFRVFKLSHEQLESLLPLSAFVDLDTAVSAACHAMNSDKLYDESVLRAGLKHSFTVLSKPPVEVMKDIRQWALECLKDESILRMIATPLQSPPLDLDFQTQTKELTERQARGILANVFFANCLDPMEKEKDTWNQGGLDWRPLLAREFDFVGVERMRCHLLYFEASRSAEEESRRIIFERIRYKPQDFFSSSSLSTDTNLPVGTGIVLHGADMEHSPRAATAFVNFANPNFGYGKFIRSCTQEEILESCCPELTIGMLWIGKMKDDEVVNVRNVRRFSTYSGYLNTFHCQGPMKDIVIQDILTMDACYDQHFTEKSMQRDLNKAYAAFRAHAASSETETRPVISTGKWGCGAFGGISAHKFVQQALAANLAGVDLDFSVFGDPESCDVVLEALQKNKPMASTVAKALKVCQNWNSFVDDFLSAIRSEEGTTTEYNNEIE